MPIYQINIFVCEKCGKSGLVSEEHYLYSDPTIIPPEGWGYGESSDKLLCEKCMAEERVIL